MKLKWIRWMTAVLVFCTVCFQINAVQMTANASPVTGQFPFHTRSKGTYRDIVREQEQESEEEEVSLTLHAGSAVLIDGYTGRILYGKNETEVLPMASTTKIMTCILALEYGNLDDQVDISAYAASMPDVQLGANVGESYRLGDLLYSLMLESHNDSAVAVAEYIASLQIEAEEDLRTDTKESTDAGAEENSGIDAEESITLEEEEQPVPAAASRSMEESRQLTEKFAEMMNQKALEIGCENTCFITPNGLDATVTKENESGEQVESTHSTTAVDLARIMRYCLTGSEKSADFLELTQTATAVFSDASGERNFSCSNHNRYLEMREGALSGKTGFTSQAGYCYVGAVNQDGIFLIAALLACGWPPSKSLKWEDMDTLIDYGQEYYTCVQITALEKETESWVAALEKENGKTVTLEELQAGISFSPFTLLMKKNEKISQIWYLEPKTAKQGDLVGYTWLRVGEQSVGTYPVTVRQISSRTGE